MIGVLVFVLGMCFGSFVNMAVYRYGRKNRLLSVPNRKRIDNKRSYCDYCGRQLEWWENIPVVSWIILEGRSKCCGEKLPVSYPLVEVISGALFVTYWSGVKFNLNSPTLIEIGLMILGVVILGLIIYSAVADLKYMILPDEATMGFLLAVVVYRILDGSWYDISSLIPYFGAGIVSLGFFWALNYFTRGRGMGWGDVKLAPVMGLFLGGWLTIVAFYTAFISGAIVGVWLLLTKKKERKGKIAFGPFMWTGTLVSWWWGKELLVYISKWI